MATISKLSLVELAALPVAMGASFYVGVNMNLQYPLHNILSVQDLAIYSIRLLPILGISTIFMIGARGIAPINAMDPSFYDANRQFLKFYIRNCNTLFLASLMLLLLYSIYPIFGMERHVASVVVIFIINFAYYIAIINWMSLNNYIVPFVYLCGCLIALFDGSTSALPIVEKMKTNPAPAIQDSKIDEICTDKCYRTNILLLTSAYILATDSRGTIVYARDKVVSYRRR